jgi:glutaredoxin
VELFVTSWCPYCKKAINFFRSHDIPYVVYDIEKDPVAARRKRELDPSPGVPFALINGHKVRGYSEEAYSRALGLR